MMYLIFLIFFQYNIISNNFDSNINDFLKESVKDNKYNESQVVNKLNKLCKFEYIHKEKLTFFDDSFNYRKCITDVLIYFIKDKSKNILFSVNSLKLIFDFYENKSLYYLENTHIFLYMELLENGIVYQNDELVKSLLYFKEDLIYPDVQDIIEKYKRNNKLLNNVVFSMVTAYREFLTYFFGKAVYEAKQKCKKNCGY